MRCVCVSRYFRITIPCQQLPTSRNAMVLGSRQHSGHKTYVKWVGCLRTLSLRHLFACAPVEFRSNWTSFCQNCCCWPVALVNDGRSSGLCIDTLYSLQCPSSWHLVHVFCWPRAATKCRSECGQAGYGSEFLFFAPLTATVSPGERARGRT